MKEESIFFQKAFYSKAEDFNVLSFIDVDWRNVSIPGISVKSWVQQDCLWLKDAPGAESLQK